MIRTRDVTFVIKLFCSDSKPGWNSVMRVVNEGGIITCSTASQALESFAVGASWEGELNGSEVADGSLGGWVGGLCPLVTGGVMLS